MPASTAVTVGLGCLGPQPPEPPAASPRGRLLYLPTREAIVVPQCRRQYSWWCAVLAWRSRFRDGGHVAVNDKEIAAAAQTVTLDPADDPDGFAMLWQARIWQTWPGGRTAAVARPLARELRCAGTLVVNLDPASTRKLTIAAHVRTPALRLLLGRLVETGLLTRTGSAPDGTLFHLTLPAPAFPPIMSGER